jgi:hypothetical protein
MHGEDGQRDDGRVWLCAVCGLRDLIFSHRLAGRQAMLPYCYCYCYFSVLAGSFLTHVVPQYRMGEYIQSEYIQQRSGHCLPTSSDVGHSTYCTIMYCHDTHLLACWLAVLHVLAFHVPFTTQERAGSVSGTLGTRILSSKTLEHRYLAMRQVLRGTYIHIEVLAHTIPQYCASTTTPHHHSHYSQLQPNHLPTTLFTTTITTAEGPCSYSSAIQAASVFERSIMLIPRRAQSCLPFFLLPHLTNTDYYSTVQHIITTLMPIMPHYCP